MGSSLVATSAILLLLLGANSILFATSATPGSHPVVATVRVGHYPIRAAVDPGTSRTYVTDIGSGAVFGLGNSATLPTTGTSTSSTTASASTAPSTLTIDEATCVSIGAKWNSSSSPTCVVPSSASVTIAQGTTVVIPKQIEIDVYGSLVNHGTVIVLSCCAPGPSFNVFRGSFTNYGNLTINGDFGIAGPRYGSGYNGTLYNYGTIKNEPGPGIGDGNIIVNEPGGTITNYGTIGIHDVGALSNSGSVTNYGTITSAGSIFNEGSITSPSFDSTTRTCSGNFYNGGTLSGSPPVNGCPTNTTSGSTPVSSSTATAGTTTGTSSTTAHSSATGQGGSGIPEFPYQPLAAVVLTVLIVMSYVLVHLNRSKNIT